MKKSNFKVLLAGLTGAFVVSVCAGSMLISASAENTDPVSSLALEYGASVRYVVGDTSKTGIRFSLKMKDSDYLAMTGEESAYSDVTFGVLIAPEYYHDIYAFNYDNVFGANAKYYLNDAEETGKEKIYNLTGALTEMETGEAGYVYFNASLIDILGVDDTDVANNIALDFRGVGYVKYTLDNETVYKFVDDDGVISDTNEYDDDNVRSMATVADAAITANTAKIAELDVEGKTEDDQKTIDFLTTQNTTLQGSYLDKVNYTLASRTYSETIDPLTTTTITVPTSVWALKDTYLAKKYTLSWMFAGSEVTAGQVIAMPTMTGTYALVGTATSVSDTDDVQTVYTKTYKVADPKINGRSVTTYGDERVGYDLTSGAYTNVLEQGGLMEFDVSSITDGDYVVQANITCTGKSGSGNMPGLIIGVGGATRLTFRALSGVGKLYIEAYNGSVSGECTVTNFSHGLGGIGGTMFVKIARVNGVYYVYNASDAFLCSIDSQGIHPNGGVTLEGSDTAKANFNTAISSFYSAGSQNAVGIYMTNYSGNSYYDFDVDYTLGSDAAASYSYGAVSVNNKTVSQNGSVTYSNGAYTANSVGVSNYASALIPLKNTITDGDYTMDMTTTVVAHSGNGHMNGFRIFKGSATVTLKYCSWEANKLVIDIRDASNVSTEFTVTNFTRSFAVGGTMLCSVVRLNNVYYIYNSDGQLGVVLDETNGVQIQSGFTASITDFTTANTRLASFYGVGDSDVLGIFSSKNGTGTYSFAYDFVRGTTAANNKVNPTA